MMEEEKIQFFGVRTRDGKLDISRKLEKPTMNDIAQLMLGIEIVRAQLLEIMKSIPPDQEYRKRD